MGLNHRFGIAFVLGVVASAACTPEEEQPSEPNCQDYCDTIMLNCTGVRAQYQNHEECISTCNNGQAWAAGTLEDEAGNTLGCRMFHSGAASNDDHCSHGGPTGGGVCGTLCDVYCAAAMKNCIDGNALYADEDACGAACAGFPDNADAATEGDSVQCRIFHVTAAAADTSHCPHASEDGAGVCSGEPENPTCANYCATITANCSGGSAQYGSEQDCLDTCYDGQAWQVGATGDAAGNTIGCREFHAGAAANDEHCAHAGPTGGEVCGSYCDVYCDAAMNNCTGANELYADASACQAACEHFATDGAVNDADGDTVQCRIFHVAAAEAAPATHCDHASASGGNVCGNWCDVYCDTVMGACTGGNQLYTDANACQAACAHFPTGGNVDDSGGNSVQCRLFHAGASWADPATHCDHAGSSGANVCGTWCDVYCDTVMGACTGANEQYASAGECATACGAFASGGNIDDAAGNTVQCRLFHAGAAWDAPATHCAHAGEASAGVCQ